MRRSQLLTVIAEFSRQYAFLSNFYPAKVILDGVEYKSVEHAYQAAKTKNHDLRAVFMSGTAAEAKRNGRRLPLRKDWENVKFHVMEDLLRQKFAHDELGSKLIGTGNAELIEGNWWGDRFWGVCRGEGLNHLGKLLMKIRSELSNR